MEGTMPDEKTEEKNEKEQIESQEKLESLRLEIKTRLKQKELK